MIWAATAKSGVHATIAGVIIGLSVGARPAARQDLEQVSVTARLFREQPTPEHARATRRRLLGAISPNVRLQYALHPWSRFVVVPLFTLAAAGVRFDTELVGRAVGSRVTLGVFFGLVLGKFFGIALTTSGAGRRRGRVGEDAGAAGSLVWRTICFVASAIARAGSGDDGRFASVAGRPLA